MSAGILFFVVGPSGVGKDTLIEGARALAPDLVYARRVITRVAGSPGEDHEALDDSAFQTMRHRGEFLITWAAHGLQYGLRHDVLDVLRQGRHVVANGSRTVVTELAARVPRLVVVEITAPAHVLEARILARGRETLEQVRLRVMRRVEMLEDHIESIRVSNAGEPAEGVRHFLEAIERTISPPSESGRLMRAKLDGKELDESQYSDIMTDILALRHSDEDVNAFLLHASQHLSNAEVLALARVRAKHMPRIAWNEPMVVDKHSMGGIPGSRITLIVTPIVAAYGLAMPKTSSRAITSASGTADAMETIARVDLSPADVFDCVSQARACIAWNGRLNHSLIDDRINSYTGPLKLKSNRWSVASILSKKYSAGATHVIVDLPCGPQAKLKTFDEANELRQLFEYVGVGLGMQVKAMVTDGTRPVGRGIGPALEARDAELVLDNDHNAPMDLREKALTFSSYILAWSPEVGSVEQGRRVAENLLASGAARAAFDRIIDAQGRAQPPIRPGMHVHPVVAKRPGTISVVNGWRLGDIARQAGAPKDLAAGVDVMCAPGQAVVVGDVLYRIHATTLSALDAAASVAAMESGVEIE